MENLVIHSDGGSRGNPGPAAIGFVIAQAGTELVASGHYIGKNTNNVAEYRAIQAALEHTLSLPMQPVCITCYLDSLLVVNQLKGLYKIKELHLQQEAMMVRQIIARLLSLGWKSVNFVHIPREENKQADRLVNLALDNNPSSEI